MYFYIYKYKLNYFNVKLIQAHATNIQYRNKSWSGLKPEFTDLEVTQPTCGVRSPGCSHTYLDSWALVTIGTKIEAPMRKHAYKSHKVKYIGDVDCFL